MTDPHPHPHPTADPVGFDPVPAITARDKTLAKQAKTRAFYETHIGRLLRNFEARIGRAWVTDQRETATIASITRDWTAADAARDELKQAIKEADTERTALRERVRVLEAFAAAVAEHFDGTDAPLGERACALRPDPQAGET